MKPVPEEKLDQSLLKALIENEPPKEDEPEQIDMDEWLLAIGGGLPYMTLNCIRR